MALFRQLQGLREEKNLQQKQIAALLNITASAYSKYERGDLQLPIAVLIELSKFYNVSTDFILGLTLFRNHTDTQIDPVYRNLIDIYDTLDKNYQSVYISLGEVLLNNQKQGDIKQPKD